MKIFFLTFAVFSLCVLSGYKSHPESIFPDERLIIRGEESFFEFQQNPQLEKVFTDIENGLSSGNVNLLSKHFSSQNYLSLSNGISGYYSSNQTYYILQDLFKISKPVSFRFTGVVANKNPYATGVLTYEHRNRKETAQVFISLEFSGSEWTISQLTIR